MLNVRVCMRRSWGVGLDEQVARIRVMAVGVISIGAVFAVPAEPSFSCEPQVRCDVDEAIDDASPLDLTLVSNTGRELPVAWPGAVSAPTGLAPASLGASWSVQEMTEFATGSGVEQPSAGPMSPIGSDGRRAVPTPLSGLHKSIVQLRLIGSSGNVVPATGFLYGPDLVVTAGHAVYNRTERRWVNVPKAYVGRNGSSSEAVCNVIEKWAYKSFINSGDSDFDIGMLKLDCNAGADTGWGNLYWTSDASELTVTAEVAGYPTDKGGTVQWYDHDKVTAAYTHRLRYLIDTEGGQSGAPIFSHGAIGDCKSNCIIGIHTSGGSSYNSGVRLTQGKVEGIMQVAALRPQPCEGPSC